MPLANLKDVLPRARAEGRALGAFNIANYETARAVITAAERENLPVIVQIYRRLIEDSTGEHLAALVRKMAGLSSVEVVLHLDHGESQEQIERAIQAGFSSVMIDFSLLPYEENLKRTLKAVETASGAGLSIEAEIGHVSAGSRNQGRLPEPGEAEKFAAETGVDALAVAIGTAHGYYVSKPLVDLELAEEVGKRTEVPLVLHGGTGTPEADILAAVKCGFAKINFSTEFQHLFITGTAEEASRRKARFPPLDIFMHPVIEKLSEYAGCRIRFLAGGKGARGTLPRP